LDSLITAVRNCVHIDKDSTQIIVDSTNEHAPDKVDSAYGDEELSKKNLLRKMHGTGELLKACFLPFVAIVFGIIFLTMLTIFLTQLAYNLIF